MYIYINLQLRIKVKNEMIRSNLTWMRTKKKEIAHVKLQK